jgi:hypothetical protein
MRARVLAATAVRGELRKLEPDLVHFASGRLAGVWPRIKADLGCQVIVSVGGAEDDSGLAGAHLATNRWTPAGRIAGRKRPS